MTNYFGLGANKSIKDKRTIQHSTLVQLGTPLVRGGNKYLPQDIEMQARVGICTAISLIQNREKANGRKYSPEFQYLLQKKYYDGNWTEGSSILNALKVGAKYGFLPKELWTYTTDTDRELDYNTYIKKLIAVSDADVTRLIGLCVDKLLGYAQVNITDTQSIASAINDSEAGIICRYDVGPEWYTSPNGETSWQPKDIDPLRFPSYIVGGHAINMTYFDYSMFHNQYLANTWSTAWDIQGSANICWDNYKMDEAWTITRAPIISKFDTDLRFGMSGDKVVNLQNALKIKGFFNWSSTGFFGIITWFSVKAFQKANSLPTTGFFGPLSRACMNTLFNLK